MILSKYSESSLKFALHDSCFFTKSAPQSNSFMSARELSACAVRKNLPALVTIFEKIYEVSGAVI